MIFKTKLLSFLFLVVLIPQVFAQTDFKPGYVIGLNNDTLIGEIDYRGDELMSHVCKYRKNKTDKPIVFTPDEINSFRFYNSKYFVSKNLNGKNLFFEFLLKGKLNLYYLREGSDNRYFLENDSSGMVELPYDEKLKYFDEKQYQYVSKKHIGLLLYFTKDAPELQSEIMKIGRPEHKNLLKITEDYHNSVCNDSSCLIFVKKLPPLRVNVELLAGYTIFPFYDSKNGFVNYAFNAHVWIPSVNEKLFFKTGVVRTKVEIQNESASLIQIPLQIEYVYPRGVVKPVLAGGINALFPVIADYTLAFSGGVNIDISKRITLDINYNIDFTHKEFIPFVPDKLFSHSLFAGLLVKF